MWTGWDLALRYKSFDVCSNWRIPLKSQSKLSLIASLLLGALAPSTSWGASIYSISIGNAQITPNGTANVEVMVLGVGDAVSLVGYEFRISSAGSASQLQFEEESESFLNDADYLFAGNSLALDDGISSSVGAVSTSVLPKDTFIGGDSSSNLAEVPVTGSKLLVTLALKHLAGPVDPATTVGQQFTVSLVPASGDSSAFSGGTSNTGFLDSSFAGVAFISQEGIITVVVPEPAAITLMIAACFVGVRVRGRGASPFRRALV